MKKKFYSKQDREARNAEQVQKVAELVVKRMKAMRDAGIAASKKGGKAADAWKQPWVTAGAFCTPRSVKGRAYTGTNALLLFLVTQDRGYSSAVFGIVPALKSLVHKTGPDGKTLHDEKGNPVFLLDGEGNPRGEVMIKKGEKAYPVAQVSVKFLPRDRNSGLEPISQQEWRQLSDADRNEYYPVHSTKYLSAFNIDQTNLREVYPEKYDQLVTLSHPNRERYPFEHAGEYVFPPLDDLIKHGLWRCPIQNAYQDRAYYRPSNDSIVLPEKKQFLSGPEYVSTAFHEMAHSTGHPARLNRFDLTKNSNPTVEERKEHFKQYAREELVAELSALSLCIDRGIAPTLSDTEGLENLTKGTDSKGKEDAPSPEQSSTANSNSYLEAWIDAIGEDPNYLMTVLSDASQATSMISRRMEAIEFLQENDADLSKYDRNSMLELENELDRAMSEDMDESRSSQRGMGR